MMDDELTLTLKSPITDEQWDKITDVDFEHTDRIWFETKHGKVEFVKASAQPEQKTGRWIPKFDGQFKGGAYWFYCSECERVVPDVRNGGWSFCPQCGAKMWVME